MASMESLHDFCVHMPKAELHAHLNGSISENTIEKLVALKRNKNPAYLGLTEQQEMCIKKGDQRTLEEVFEMFPIYHSLTDTAEALELATSEVIREFAEDNVKYLELRTTPKPNVNSGMTKKQYIDAVLKAIQDTNSSLGDRITTRLILSVDRRQSLNDAQDTVDMAIDLAKKRESLVVGLDLSGDPRKDGRPFLPMFRRASEHGLKTTFHIAEISSMSDEVMDLLHMPPDRIGHGTCLDVEMGGCPAFVDEVTRIKIPLEICLSSNVKCGTVASIDNHHLGFWLAASHPVLISTDDKGLFDTCLSKEYAIAAETFDLDKAALLQLSKTALDFAFLDDSVKQRLMKHWVEFEHEIKRL